MISRCVARSASPYLFDLFRPPQIVVKTAQQRKPTRSTTAQRTYRHHTKRQLQQWPRHVDDVLTHDGLHGHSLRRSDGQGMGMMSRFNLMVGVAVGEMGRFGWVA